MSVPQLVGVYGGGRMGAGIAHAFIAAVHLGRMSGQGFYTW